MKIQLRPDATDPFLFREGLELGTVYTINDKHDLAGNGDSLVYYIKHKAYSALRFDVVSGQKDTKT